MFTTLFKNLFKKRNTAVSHVQEHSLHVCAWCEKEISPDAEVYGFNAKAKPGVDLSDKKGTRVMLNASVAGMKVPAFVAADHSEAKRQGYDLVFMTCSSECAESLRMVLAAEKHLFDGIAPSQSAP